MKKLLFLGAAVAMGAMMTSCSNDEVVSQNADNQIQFNVRAEGQTRAANIFCNNNMPASFTVYANAGSDLYMEGDVITYTDGAWTNSVTRYWPKAGTQMSFWAFVNDDKTFDYDSKKFVDFTVKELAKDQLDLLYAYQTASREQGKAPAAVNLNFRHALSQVVYTAKIAEDALIDVELRGIEICGLTNKGTYAFPEVATTSNLAHDPAATADVTDNSRGNWTLSTDEANTGKKYALTVENAMKMTTTAQAFPAATTEEGKAFSNALMLLPQTQTAWVAANSTLTGAYFLLDVKVTSHHKADSKEMATEIWNGNIAIPANIDWKEGFKYTYNFTFGKGNGGYDPENPNTPVLVKISYTVTADEFIAADAKENEL